MDPMTGTEDRRVFLGLNRPPLQSAAAWLIERGPRPSPTCLDLDNYLVVLPTQRACDRLLQLLIRGASESNVSLVPPRLATVGQLPEYLYAAEKPLATDLAQQLAWSKALAQTPDEELQCLTGRTEVDDLQQWQPLATLISRLHKRLANDIWSFRSVAREVKQDPKFLAEEASRWDALNAMQQRYYTLLHEANLWDRQAARNYAAAGLLKANEIRCATDRQIVLIGVADLNRSVSEMVRQVQTANPTQVDILVAADDAMAHRFDPFGSLITDQWLDQPIDLDERQIRFVDQPGDQADAATYFIKQMSGSHSCDQITVGVPDTDLIPQLERSLSAVGLPHRNLAGKPLAATSPVKLMLAAKAYLEDRRFDSYAALVRHPDLFAWLIQEVEQDDWLGDLDRYQNFFLPNQIALENPIPFGDPDALALDFDDQDPGAKRRAIRAAAVARTLNKVHACLAELLLPLTGPDRPIADWTDDWSRILVAVYGQRTLNTLHYEARQIIQACDAIYTALGNQSQVPLEFDARTSASQSLDWAIQAASELRVLPSPVPDAIELAGWLDLALDDAPAMVITGMNDEHVPTSEIGHQFLPNELCKTLGILDNDRRYARDMYALTVIRSVRDDLLLIAGRRNESGDPKKPSRLLFATDAQTAARRAKAYFSFSWEASETFWLTDKPRSELPTTQQLEIPQPICHQPLGKLSVTKFRDYIQCPYRFYLKHVLKLDTVADDWNELSGGTFGDLCHNVLEHFGRSPQRELDSPEALLEFWNDTLSDLVAKQYSGSRMPSVQIQVQQLRMRLERFAPLQAQHRRDGWQIVSTEEMLEHEFMVDGQPFIIRGKIDRVDRHESTGQVAVWDYKSSDQGETADRKHYLSLKQQWKDLQLPLYRHLVKEVSVVADADFNQVITGYILLPKKLESIGFDPTSWDANVLQSADEEARRIIRQLRDSVFWPPTLDPPPFSQDFSAICQDAAFEKFDVSEPEVAAPW